MNRLNRLERLSKNDEKVPSDEWPGDNVKRFR